MNWIKRLFAPTSKPSPLHPLAFGFTQKHAGIYDYEKDGFCLSHDPFRNVWVFDKVEKAAPGIIARFDSPLLEEDFDYMLAYIERTAQTTEG